MRSKTLLVALLILAALLAGCGGKGQRTTPTTPAQVTTVGVKQDPVQQHKLVMRVPAKAVQQVEAGSPEHNLREPSEPKQAGPPRAPPTATPHQAGCRNRFIDSYSSRGGAAIQVIVLHYTVSPNVPGWADVDGVTAFFAKAKTQASSNFVNDATGHCNYIVPEYGKAWAQINFNRVAVSVEQVNTGKEKTYAGTAGLRQLGRIVSDSARRNHIPLRRAIVTQNGCRVVKRGVIDHHALGACGGGHFDISPPYSVASVIAAAKRARCSHACRLRRSHTAVHKAIKSHRCAPETRTRSRNCKAFYARNHSLHAQARRDHVKL